MNIKRYLRPAAIILLTIIALYANHLSVSFGNRQLCDVAMFTGEIPSYCYDSFQLKLQPWQFTVVDQLGQNNAANQRLIAERDSYVFVVDGIIILLAALALKRPKAK
ncbi:TPA: hypothetical protein DEP96_00050 [Candidatus Uhrbacteria bacterium]|nr:hypothetical protein [Candidatus Uhrbacteria bacterium]